MQEKFRGRNKKVADLQASKDAATAKNEEINLLALYIGLSKRVFTLEKQMRIAKLQSEAADYRSLATMKLLAEKLNVSPEELDRLADEILIREFDKQDAAEDVAKGLVPAPAGAKAEDGMHAVFSMRLFLKDKELIGEAVPRSKLEIGRQELFPEVDVGLVGMAVGESKMIGLSVLGKTDKAELTLVALKQQAPKEASDEKAETVHRSGYSQVLTDTSSEKV